MGLRVESVIFSLLTMLYIEQSVGDTNSSNSGEDTILKDALLLVKLLKSKDTPSNLSALFPTWKISAPRSPESPINVAPLQNIQPTSDAATGTFNRNYRRMMTNENDDNAKFVSPPLGTNMAFSTTVTATKPSSANEITSSTVPRRVQTTKPATATSVTRKHIKITRSKSLRRSVSHPTKRQNKTKSHRLLKTANKIDPKHKTTSNHNEDQSADFIIRSQVLSEMENEVKGLREKDALGIDLNKQLKLRKPTLRVHLSRSTRYKLPLPQNHAFCFTNPNNGLCRSLV